MLLLNSLLNNIKRAYLLRQGAIYFCFYGSNLVLNTLRILTLEGYILGFNTNGYYVRIKLRYSKHGVPALKILHNFSKPTSLIYIKQGFLLTKKGYGTLLSTHKGLCSFKRALQGNLGGRLLCRII